MEMENPLKLQCQQLLTRIRTSNIQAFFPKTRSKSQNESHLQSLSLHRRKLNQSMKRQYSFTGGFNLIMPFKEGKFKKFNERPQTRKQSISVCQPQFNLRKGKKGAIPIKPLRQPFTNLTNVNKLKLTLDKDHKIANRSLNKSKGPIEQSLHVNGLVTRYHQENMFFSLVPNQKPVSFGPSSIMFNKGSDDAVENTSKVNDIYSFVKEKVHQEGEEIDEFTEIIFKLVCYFFLSYMTEKGCNTNFDPHRMINFIEKEVHQSYSALNSLKVTNNQGSSLDSKKVNSEKPKIVRINRRVSSFFKSVEHTENESPFQPSKLQSLRKFNQAISGTDESQNPYPKKLKAQQNNGKRESSIMLNSVKEDKAENSERTSSNKTETDESSQFTNTFEVSNDDDNIPQSNQRLPKISIRTSTTRRKSCFLTEMNHQILLQKQTSQGEAFHANTSQGSNIKINYQGISKNCSGSDLPSQSHSKLAASSSVAISNSKIQGYSKHKQSNSKSKIKSKASMNLSTPYDFVKDDNLMTKRRKYLQINQQISKMTQNIEQLKTEEEQIIQRIQLKDSELIEMENKLIDINQQIQMYHARTKEAEDFLNGPECPQMVQKIMKKKNELKKNLTSLLNSHAWETSNLMQSSHAQNIFSTKQTSMDKLNSLTRKFRTCKSLQNIESLVSEMRDSFLFTNDRYSQIIEELQDKLQQAEGERSKMLKNLEDWEIQNKIKEKLLTNSFLDYYSVERKVTTYIEKLPETLRKLQQSIYALSHQRKNDYVVGLSPDLASQSNVGDANNSSRSLDKQNTGAQSKKILMIEKQMVTCLDKMLLENGQIATELPKQTKFAMVLEKIV